MKIIFAFFLLLTINASGQDIDSKITEFQKPIMGWSSWNNYRININEQLIKSQADAIIELGLDKFGYQYVNIDDGYFGGRDENGQLLSHPQKFPNGMKVVSDYIHSKGLKAGIYTDAGKNTCGTRYDNDAYGKGVGLYGHDEQDLNLLLNEWNYDFIKVDWCGGKWLKLDTKTRYTEIINQAKEVKPTVIFNICRWEFPGEKLTQISNSWRISGDIRKRFRSILRIIDLNEPLAQYCQPGHYNDMDMLQVGRGMTYEEDKSHFTMWAMMHSPLLLSCDLNELSEETLSIITNEEIIALNQSDFVYQAKRIATDGKIEIWGKPIHDIESGEIVVALLNRSKSKKKITLPLKIIGLNHQEGYTIRDLWSKENFETSKSTTISQSIPPHGIILLKIKGTRISESKIF
ncbi:MAG TPA: glycoside hydrolase family 27 protein [Chitinophagales bacterium]|nr:glycoside hydrolase family 27 protein [Chitinophagales bacterium]